MDFYIRVFVLVSWIAIIGCVREVKETPKDVWVYSGATPGTFVSRIRPNSQLESSIAKNVHLKISGSQAKRYFEVDGRTLKVKSKLSSVIGYSYNVLVEGFNDRVSRKSLARWQFNVTITEKNLHAPHFIQDVFTAEAHRFASVGTNILQIEAFDEDKQPYNSEVKYFIEKGETSEFFSMDRRHGWIKSASALTAAEDSILHLQVTATDTGSPPLSRRASVTIILRDLAAPTNLSVNGYNRTSANLCWHPPSPGTVHRYMVTYAPSGRPDMMERKTLNSQSADSQPLTTTCYVLRGLQPEVEYWAEVRALDGGTGVPARTVFHTRLDACSQNPCLRGSCKLNDNSDEGFDCICGEEGKICPQCIGAACGSNEVSPQDCDDQELQCRRIEECFNGGKPVNESGTFTCICQHGFMGKRCETRRPYCDEDSCRNSGWCETDPLVFEPCRCRPSWIGDYCEYRDPCWEQPCNNGGMCQNEGYTKYSCQCLYGYYGSSCDQYNPCFSAPCQNAATCINITETSYLCTCRQGYHGDECEMYNPCFHEPCLFGGMCNSIDGAYECECMFGRWGRNCERINLCEMLEPCGPNTQNCRNITDEDYICECKAGWSGNNCTNFDPCHDNPCKNSGTCMVSPDGRAYECLCEDDGVYYGENCEYTNPCILLDPCKNDAICVNTSDTEYKCSCTEGYYGPKCENYNPCVKNPCQNGGRCVNTSVSSYTCVCQHPYFGSSCQYFNSCTTDPCKHGNCITLENGKYFCECTGGFTGLECQYFDPCASSPCLNSGSCRNTSNTLDLCSCREGFSGMYCQEFDSCQRSPCREGTCVSKGRGQHFCLCPEGLYGPTCESTDPCAARPCEHQGSCISTHVTSQGPAFRCMCATGFYGSKCENFNPCVMSPCLNSATCRHTSNDSFICDCPDLFQGTICDEVIPCNSVNKPCAHGGQCVRRDGRVACACRGGYSGTRCQHYNPCSAESPCMNGASCVRNSEEERWECQCMSGYFGERCEYHRPCKAFTCQNGGTCVETEIGELCKCKDGFKGEQCESDIDECEWVQCQNGGECINRRGSFLCDCAPGFRGKFCDLPEVCEEESVYQTSGVYVWPITSVGVKAVVPCPRNPKSSAKRVCELDYGDEVVWSKADVSECSIEVKTASEAREALSPFKNSSLSMLESTSQMAAAAELLDHVIPLAWVDQQVALDLLKVIDNILDVKNAHSIDCNISSRILEIIEDFQRDFRLPDRNFTAALRNLLLNIRVTTVKEEKNGVYFEPDSAQSEMVDDSAKLVLPPEIFDTIPGTARVQFSYFPSSRLFRGKEETWQDTGPVIGASLGDLPVDGLKNCVIYNVPVTTETPRKCVFWDKAEMRWSTKGVITLKGIGSTISCCSNHLSYFSTVDGEYVEPLPVSGHEYPIFLASLACTGAAIFTLFLVLLTYSLFRCLNKENFGQAVMQFSISLLLSVVCNLIGFHRVEVNNETICLVVAVLTQYFTITTLLWLSVLAQHVYSLMGREFQVKDRFFILKGCFVAWGLPIIAVGVPLGKNIAVYQGNTDRCLISQENKWYFCGAYLTPCCLVLLTNFVLFCLLVKVSWKPRYQIKGFIIGISQVRGTYVLIAFLGLTWIVGYLAERPEPFYLEAYIYEYAFFGCHTLIALTVFISYCVLRKEVRTAWCQGCCRCCIPNNRRRVVGKKSPGATKIKSDGSDYHLVADQKHSPRPQQSEDDVIEHDVINSANPQTSHCVMPDISHPYHHIEQPTSGIVNIRTLPLHESSTMQRQYRAIQTDCPDSPIHHFSRVQHPGPRGAEGTVHQPACHVGAASDTTFPVEAPYHSEPTYMNVQTYSRSPGDHSRHYGESHIGGDWMVHTKI